MISPILILILICVILHTNKKYPRFRVLEISKIVNGKISFKYYPQHRAGPFWCYYSEGIYYNVYETISFDSKSRADEYLRGQIEEVKYGNKKRKYYVG